MSSNRSPFVLALVAVFLSAPAAVWSDDVLPGQPHNHPTVPTVKPADGTANHGSGMSDEESAKKVEETFTPAPVPPNEGSSAIDILLNRIEAISAAIIDLNENPPGRADALKKGVKLNEDIASLIAALGQEEGDPRVKVSPVGVMTDQIYTLQNDLNDFVREQNRLKPNTPVVGEGENAVAGNPGGNVGRPINQIGNDIRRNIPKEMIKNFPNDYRGYTGHGANQLEDDDNEGAFDSFDTALGLGADDAETYAGYAGAAMNLGDYNLARRSASLALERDPNNMTAFGIMQLTRGRVSMKNLPSALDGARAARSSVNRMGAAQAAASRLPPSSQLYPTRYTRMTPTEIAAEAQKQAKAPPSKVQQSKAVTRESASALKVKDYTKAHESATRAIELNRKNAQAWNYRAIANNKLGRYGDAVTDASYSLGLAPGNAPALQSRSWAFNKLKKYREGLGDANYTLEIDPRNAFAYQNRAFSLAGMGENPEAIAALKRSAELAPQFRGKYEEALQVPEDGDLLFLFEDKPAAMAASAPAPLSPAQKKRKFMRLLLIVLSGGALVAMGLVHIITGSLSQTVKRTVRRVLGSAPPAEAMAASEDTNTSSTVAGSQFELVKEIGSGGMGVVYEGRDTSLDRPVAVKKMRDEFRLDGKERERFLAEARTVATMHHPNIVDIYSILEDAGDIYLVFEFVKGRTLAQLVEEKGTLSFEFSKRVLRDACAAVEYAHKQKVVHRDIKPSNIMINEEGVAKVMDFGVAREAKDAMTNLQRTNTVVGTPPYMAPEQEQGTVRKESDVYSLGICFYEMLSGKLPFEGRGAGMLLNKMNGKYTPITQVVSDGIPPGLDEVLAKVLSPDPENRYKTPAEFHNAVAALGDPRPV